MRRLVEPEILDRLPPDEPDAVASRRDLHRLNGWMNHARRIAAALREACGPEGPATIVELGAGDGRFALRLVRELSARRGEGMVVLVDRQPFRDERLAAEFARRGWQVKQVCADVFDWLSDTTPISQWLVANLFLHHFTEEELGRLLTVAATRCEGFVACEPRRALTSLMLSRLVGLIGCNAITRHDAVISVRAGFRDRELGALWPASGWHLEERNVGLASHFFAARRDVTAKPASS